MSDRFSKQRKKRSGFSLLELLITAALTATLASTSMMLLRSARTAWEAQEHDQSRLAGVHAVARHIVRRVRQADSISAISLASNTAGNLSLVTETGDTYSWSLSGTNVMYSVNGSPSLLAENITELSFTGYEADGTTATTTVDNIQSIQCTVKTNLTMAANNSRTVTCRAWSRSW